MINKKEARQMKQYSNFINVKKMTAYVSVFLAFIICLSAVYAFAEYTKSSRAKRVIATYGSGGMLFSSNKLEPELDDTFSAGNFSSYTRISNFATILTGAVGSTATADITICNYAQGQAGKYNDADITYTLYAKLVKIDGGTVTNAAAADVSGLSVTLNYKNTTVVLDPSKLSHTFTEQTLFRSAASVDSCGVSFSSGFNSDTSGIRLFLAAIPSNSDLLPLTAMINTSIRSAQTQSEWRGYFNEKGALDPTNANLPQPTDLDGFNYVVTGNGDGTVKLRWRGDLIEINDVFLQSLSLTTNTETTGGTTWTYVTFDVDSNNKEVTITENGVSTTVVVPGISRYDTQFYFVDKNDTDFPDWTTVNGYVECIYPYTPSP